MMFNNMKITSSYINQTTGEGDDDVSHVQKANVHCSICTDGATDEELALLLRMHQQELIDSYYHGSRSAQLTRWYIQPKHKYSPNYFNPSRRYSPLKSSAGILGRIMDESMTSTEDRIGQPNGERLYKDTLAFVRFTGSRREEEEEEEVHCLRGHAGERMKQSFRKWNAHHIPAKPRLRADLVKKLRTSADSGDVLLDGTFMCRPRQDDRMLLLASEAPSIAASENTSPYQAVLARLRMERIQMEGNRTTKEEEQLQVDEEQLRVEEEELRVEEEELRVEEEELRVEEQLRVEEEELQVEEEELQELTGKLEELEREFQTNQKH